MTPLNMWLDTSPESYLYRAALAAECALGIGQGNERLAIAELDAECAVSEGLTEMLARFGAREAVRFVKERERRDRIAAARQREKAERQATADRINEALEAEKSAKKRRQKERLERLIANGPALSPETTMPVNVADIGDKIIEPSQRLTLPDYSAENVGVAL